MAKFRGVSSSPFFYDAGPEIFALARTLRTNMTNAEKLLWKQIGYKRMEGYHFRRQHPLGRIIVDFFCWEAKLVIEVDGEIHKTPYQKERDVERTNIITGLGLTEIRFTNDQIEKEMDFVLTIIKSHLKK